MKKQGVPMLVAVTLLFIGFTFGFFLGRMRHPEPVTLTVPASFQSPPAETSPIHTESSYPEPVISFPIDINRAQKEDFMALPGIGDVLAQRILDYREKYGLFTSPEDLMYVEGIGQKRMEEILDLISIGG